MPDFQADEKELRAQKTIRVMPIGFHDRKTTFVPTDGQLAQLV
jgi:hypothetical protein